MRIQQRPRTKWERGVVICVAACLISACAASPAVRAARRGDVSGLKAAIATDRSEGRLHRKRVRDIAREAGMLEIRRAAMPDALARIDEARACTRALADALEERAKKFDDAGAAAALALWDGRSHRAYDGAAEVRRHGHSPSPLWRAVAARASGSRGLGDQRRTFYVDPDERVRLAALRAALEAPDPADGPVLLETARLDPNPVAQGLAARALGGIAHPGTVLGLRDVYTTADEGLRQSIVGAWGRPEAAAAGGLRELVLVAENQHGAFAIEAGALLLRFPAEPGAWASGKRALLQGMSGGLSRDRVLAIGHAKVADPDMREALRKAAETDDVALKTAALSRLTEWEATRRQALLDLQKLADGGSKSAVFALARTGDCRAIDVLEQELSSPDRGARLAAMAALVGIGELARAASLLTDSDPHVRMMASCSILAAP